MKDTMSTCLPPSPQWSPLAPERPQNREQRRTSKAALLAALKATNKNGPVGTDTPTSDEVRTTINQTLAGTAVALKQGLPGVDFLLVGLRHDGGGQADVFMKGTLPPEARLLAAEVLEGLARHFRGQTDPAAPPETPVAD